jgi:hypothetical protein
MQQALLQNIAKIKPDPISAFISKKNPISPKEK